VTAEYRCVPLNEHHRCDYLHCGYEHIDRWLSKQALAQQNLGRSATHVWADDEDIVVAYFTLLQTTIREGDGSIFSRFRPPGFPRDHELPGILIGKLALDENLRGGGRGLDLLADAYITAFEAVMLIGGAVLVVEPMNDRVATFYREFGFNGVEGSDRMVLNFREFNRGTPIS